MSSLRSRRHSSAVSRVCTLSELWSSVALSEYLHFCYLSYVSVIPGVAAYWYATGCRRAFHELVLLLSIVLLCSYLFFILFPVDSPYYLAAPLDPPLSGHFFYEVVHALSSQGGARGGAFPERPRIRRRRGLAGRVASSANPWRLSWHPSSAVSSWRPFTGASTTHSTPLLASRSPWRLSLSMESRPIYEAGRGISWDTRCSSSG